MARERTSSSRLQPLARAVLHAQSDDRLVALARDGKEAAFEEIVRRYRSSLVAFAAAYGPPDPEDVVQESLARSWDALRRSTGEMHLKAWLYTIVRNRSLNAKRDSRLHEPLSDDLDGVRQPHEIVLNSQELDRAVAAVVALPDAQREALVRSSLEGHTHEQIAASLGATPGAVRQLIYRARLTVRHGVGAVIPLPLVAVLAEAGTGAAGVGGGAFAGGAAAGGASVATKATLAIVIGAIAAGSGVAIERSQHDSAGQGDPTTRLAAGSSGASVGDGTATIAESPAPGGSFGSSGPGPGRDGSGEAQPGDNTGHGGGAPLGDGGSSQSGSSLSSGPGSSVSGEAGTPSGSGGDSNGSGDPGSGESGGGGDSSGSSGHGSPGSGSSDPPEGSSDPSGDGSGSSGSPDGSGETTTIEDPLLDGSSGSGSGGSGSGDGLGGH